MMHMARHDHNALCYFLAVGSAHSAGLMTVR